MIIPGGNAPRPHGTRPDESLPSVNELEQTLSRLVRRVAMLIQAEKCIFLLHDRERHQLVARPPALGFTPEQIKSMRVPLNKGVSGAVFKSGEPMTVPNIFQNNLVDQQFAERLEIRNAMVQPLITEQRDEHQQIVSREVIGVLQVLNKRDGQAFTAEDARLVAIMARQITAVLANAQLYLKMTEEREHLQATLQSLMAGVVMVESTGHISLINSAARHIFGLEDENAVGKQYSEVITQHEIIEMLRDATEGGLESQREIELTPRGASEVRIFQGQTAFVRSEDERASVIGVVAIFNDITEIRGVERMKTAFVSTVSHELRTPLTSIKGFISTLLQDTNDYYDKETRLEFYGIIDSECDRLQRLIEDLLNVSRIESGRALQMNWALFEPLATIEKVLQAQGSYTDKHQFRLETEGIIPSILGDADKFDQILTNLLSNAVKYSPHGGEIVVYASSDEDVLRVAVRDHGIGIPADKVGRIFEKFERVDDRDTRSAGGTGIGLFLVKHLIERHQGHIHVESEVGKGSTFIFEIPLHPAQADQEMRQLDEKARHRFGSPN